MLERNLIPVVSVAKYVEVGLSTYDDRNLSHVVNVVECVQVGTPPRHDDTCWRETLHVLHMSKTLMYVLTPTGVRAQIWKYEQNITEEW